MQSMTFHDFNLSLGEATPPQMPPLLTAMWWDAKGDWSRAHEIAQDITAIDGSRVHAYLHRKEGDSGNAGYWYHRAGHSPSRLPLEEEWSEIVQSLLANP